MRDLSLFILDIAQNSVAAGARKIDITVKQTGSHLTFSIRDDGCGMDAEMLARVTDPFTTTRTTRPVGLGLSLLRMAAEQTGGGLEVESAPGKGTQVTARFDAGHVDAPPTGDLAETVSALIQSAPNLAYTWTHETDGRRYDFDTGTLDEILDGVSLGEPAVARWIFAYISEQEALLTGHDKEE